MTELIPHAGALSCCVLDQDMGSTSGGSLQHFLQSFGDPGEGDFIRPTLCGTRMQDAPRQAKGMTTAYLTFEGIDRFRKEAGSAEPRLSR